MKDGNIIHELKKKDALFVICLGLVTVLITLWPVLITGITHTSQDEMFHMARIESLATALRHGVFPSKLRPSLLYTYGYGVGFFYPDFFLYLPAGLMYLGLSLKQAYQVYLVTATCLSYGLTAYATAMLSRSVKAGAIAGALATMATLYLANVYDGSAGMIVAYPFFAAAIAGFFMILQQRGGGYLFCAGILGCLLSHIITFVMLLFTGILLCILCIPQLKRYPKALLSVLKSGIYCVLFGAGFLFPMLEQMAHTLYVGMSDRRIYDIREHVASVPEMVASVGAPLIVLFIATIPGILFLWKKGQKVRLHLTLLIVTLLLMVATCSQTFWNYAYGVLGFLQVSIRLTSPVAMLCAMLTGITADQILSLSKPETGKRRQGATRILTIVICTVTGLLLREGTGDYLYDTPPKSYEIEWNAVQQTGLEWIPYDCYNIDLEQTERSEDEGKGGALGVKHDDGTRYDVYVDLSHEYYDVPYIYYYGYQAYLVDDAMNPTAELVTEKGRNGMTRVHLPKDGDGIGHILVTYRKTKIQILSYGISMLTVIATAIAVLAGKRRRNGTAA